MRFVLIVLLVFFPFSISFSQLVGCENLPPDCVDECGANGENCTTTPCQDCILSSQVPIDGGIVFLAVGGILIGIRKLKK